ncbi:MAG: trans-2-enoyl-CoA reductase family protein [Oscillospiraceae bacterium]|nr:trans-2-enoyl-CoA reductase family protein [Oscillospiraceae bacterium]
MVIKPKVRGFICTTAHPVGCAENVRLMAEYAQSHPGDKGGPKRVLVIGSSAGYGLATRVSAAFGYGADTVGVFLEKPGAGGKTATAGWYNNAAFEKLARKNGLVAESVCGDAYATAVKEETLKLVAEKLGQVDLVVYSLASPRRTHPVTGVSYQSALKPIGATFEGQTVNTSTGELSRAVIEPATEEEAANTVTVMGGEDWRLWMDALLQANLLADGVVTLAYSYIGPAMTHAIYRDGCIGKAKEDLENTAKEVNRMLENKNGRAFVSVNKALVTQASSAIPVVPLYISILFKVMKEQSTHEGCIEQMVRMMARIYDSPEIITDGSGRLRLDDWEMEPNIQREVNRIWNEITQENLESLADLAGYRHEFYRLFGFETPGVDYAADLPEDLI